jgi:hypothetical protein
LCCAILADGDTIAALEARRRPFGLATAAKSI